MELTESRQENLFCDSLDLLLSQNPSDKNAPSSQGFFEGVLASIKEHVDRCGRFGGHSRISLPLTRHK